MEPNERVRSNTAALRNEIIDKEILESIKYYYYHRDQIEDRITELEKEWDIERVIALNAAGLAFVGSLLGATVSKKWLILPMLVGACLLQHSTQGWCPPLPFLRSLGIRTRREIDREKYALKTLLGDFDIPKRTKEIWDAVK